jgi:tetratricopeptide (TPR) repeat protein
VTKKDDVSFDDTVAPPSDPSLDRTAAAATRPSQVSYDDTVAGVPERPSGSVAPDLDLEIGARIGRYVVSSKLGAGGMGVVLAAYDPELDRKVAIKLVRPGEGLDPEGLRARMVREAQAMARLAHPNVLAVYDVGTVGDDVFVAMELVEGTTLGKWLDTKRSRREILRVFDQAGRGLAAAHAAGLVHRDFKPDNVMIGKDGRVRVMDFGLARQTEVAEPVGAETPGKRMSALSIELTHAGALLGTPVYMAPEQWAGQPADARSDQYAFCVALWEALYGQRPFSATTLDELHTKVTSKPPDPPPPEIKLPRRLGGALRRGLEKDPAARFPKLETLLDELAAEPLARRRLAIAAGALGLLGAGVGVAMVAQRGAPVAASDPGCDDPAIQLKDVWDQPRKQAVHTALLATKSPIAEQTWSLLEHEVDAKAGDYLRVLAPTCHGTYRVPEHLRAAQTACLGRVKSQLGAFTELLGDLKPAELKHVVERAWALPAAAPCEDPAVLGQRLPPPADPKVAAEVEQIRQLLEKSSAAKAAGRGKPAKELADEAFARAQKVDYPDARGLAGMAVGQIAVAMGDDKRGEPVLQEAYTTLLAASDDHNAASVATALAKLIGSDRQQPDKARPWLDQSRALVQRLGTPADLDIEWQSAAGMIRYAVGDMDGARPYFEKQVELERKQYGEADPHYAIALSNLAGVLLMKGDLQGAEKMSRQALEIRKKSLGPEHPDVAENVMNLGLILSEVGTLDEAEADERAALALREKVLGPEHGDIVITLFNLGSVLFKEKKFGEARDVGERALALSQKLHGDDYPDTADALENLADAYDHLDNRAKALELEKRVLAIRKKILEPGHPDIHRAEQEIRRFSGK